MKQKDLQHELYQVNSIAIDGGESLPYSAIGKHSLDIETIAVWIDDGNNRSKLILKPLSRILEYLNKVQNKPKI